MFLVLEGQRATGKTTLSQYISEELGIKRLKFTRSANPVQQMSEMTPRFERDIIILDRWHLTEYVMRKSEAPSYEEYDREWFEAFHRLHLQVKRYGGFVVVLRSSEPVRIARREQAGRADEPYHEEVRRLWAEAADRWADLVLDTTNGDLTKRIALGIADALFHKGGS